MAIIFLGLFLLQLKHWYIDFSNQTSEEVAHKGIYLDWRGVKHSVKHGIGTFAVLWILGVDVTLAWFLGCIDFIIHYHIDYFKMKYGSKDITTKEYWEHFGLDQMLHQITYLGIIFAAWIL